MNKDFKEIVIPYEIWLHPKLSCIEKGIWAEIYNHYDENRGGCSISNKELAQFLEVKENTIAKSITKLRKLGFIKDISFDGRVRVVLAILGGQND